MNASNDALRSNRNDRKSIKCKTRQGKEDDGDPADRVNLQGKVGIQSGRYAQDKTVAACSRLRYREALFWLLKA
jgi:hypothetical protein